MNKIIIGYVVWTDDGPQRNIRSKDRWFQRKEPIKVYQTENIARRYGLNIKPVFVEEEE